MDSLFIQFSAILAVASLLGLICHKLKQPLIFAYLVTGMIAGLIGSQFAPSAQTWHFLADLGIAFLLFLVGLELSLNDIKRLGKTVVLTAAGQITVTAIVGFGIALLLKTPIIAAGYIALGLTFSSTIIAVKYLTDQQSTETLHAKVALGLLLVQDVVALAALILLSSLQTHQGSGLWWLDAALMLSKGATLITATIFFSRSVLPPLFRAIASSTELLVLASIGWCVIGAATAEMLGFSVEIGAFLAGLSLSSSSYQFQIASRIKPLRDFFVTLFFIVLGLQMALSSIQQIILPALALSLFALIANPLVSAILLGRFGYKRHTAFFATLLISPIGEFSLVLAALGVKLGQLSAPQASQMALTVLITMLASSYLMKHQQALYRKLKPFMTWIEIENPTNRHVNRPKLSDHVVILGAHRLGGEMLEILKGVDAKIVVVDYDPERIAALDAAGYHTIFGDATDEAVLQEAGIGQAKLIISSLDQHHAIRQLLQHIAATQVKAPVIVTASSIEDALTYYRLGAAYVIIPMLISGSAVTDLIRDHWSNVTNLEPAKLLHLQRLAAKGYIL